MHDKYSIVDGHLVETGSFNYTERAQNVNRENVQIHDDANLASQYSANFEEIWGSSDLEAPKQMRDEIRMNRAEFAGPEIF